MHSRIKTSAIIGAIVITLLTSGIAAAAATDDELELVGLISTDPVNGECPEGL